MNRDALRELLLEASDCFVETSDIALRLRLAANALLTSAPRKPLGIAQQGEYSQAVLCDDGALFTRSGPSGWKEEPPVPGTKRAQEKARG